jgi:hypothetical protein
VGARGVGVRSPAALLLGVLLCVVVPAVTGCGASEYNYVTNSADRTYFKVPSGWQEIDQRELAGRFGDGITTSTTSTPGFWMVGYDANPAPALTHMLGPHTDEPVLLARVQHVPPQARGQLSLDAMRDSFLPVSETARAQAGFDPTSTLTGFALYSDEVLTPGGGIRGVHTVFRYRIDGGPFQIFDLTGYINDDASKLYQLLVRCSASCYDQRRAEIETIVSSFTVRENP